MKEERKGFGAPQQEGGQILRVIADGAGGLRQGEQ